MPIHPTPVSCETCSANTQMGVSGMLPPGWTRVEATETIVVEPEVPELELPEDTPAEFVQYLQQFIAQVAGDGPRLQTLRGVGVYCPKCSGALQTKLDFPDREEWAPDEEDEG